MKKILSLCTLFLAIVQGTEAQDVRGNESRLVWNENEVGNGIPTQFAFAFG